MFNPKFTALREELRNYWDRVPEDMRERMAKIEDGPYWNGDYDQAELDLMRERMGIEWPVTIVADDSLFADLAGVLWGQWTADQVEPELEGHTVRIQPGISLEVAHEILAHELTHAMQLERDGWAEVIRQNQEMEFKKLLFGQVAYEQDPAELEAEENRRRYASTLNVLR